MISWKQVCLWLVGATLLLSGCAPGNFDPTFGVWPGLRTTAVEDHIVEATTICPPLVEYDAEFLAQAADEISALAESSKLIRLVHDYGTLRAMLRQC